MLPEKLGIAWTQAPLHALHTALHNLTAPTPAPAPFPASAPRAIPPLTRSGPRYRWLPTAIKMRFRLSGMASLPPYNTPACTTPTRALGTRTKHPVSSAARRSDASRSVGPATERATSSRSRPSGVARSSPAISGLPLTHVPATHPPFHQSPARARAQKRRSTVRRQGQHPAAWNRRETAR